MDDIVYIRINLYSFYIRTFVLFLWGFVTVIFIPKFVLSSIFNAIEQSSYALNQYRVTFYLKMLDLVCLSIFLFHLRQTLREEERKIKKQRDRGKKRKR